MSDKYVFVSVPLALSKTLTPRFEVCYPADPAPDSQIAVAIHPAAGVMKLLQSKPAPNGDVVKEWTMPENATIYEFECQTVNEILRWQVDLRINGILESFSSGHFDVQFAMFSLAKAARKTA